MPNNNYIENVIQSVDGKFYASSCITERVFPNSELEVHPHCDELEIYRFIEGDLFFAFEGKRFEVSPGSIIIIINGTLHRPVIKNPCRYYRERILFSKDIFGEFGTGGLELYNRLRNKKIITLHDDESFFVKMFTLLSDKSPYSLFQARIEIFSFLIKAEQTAPNNPIATTLYSNKTSALLKYIDTHLDSDLSYKSLSKQFHISEASLYKFIKNETGFALANYITERRIVTAQSLLNSGVPASEAALRSGFTDYTSFYRAFVKTVGLPPSQYIKKVMPNTLDHNALEK